MYERGTFTEGTKGEIFMAEMGLQLFTYLITTKSNNEVSWHYCYASLYLFGQMVLAVIYIIGSSFEFLPAFIYIFIFLGKQFAHSVAAFWNLWSMKEGRSSGSGHEVHLKN